MISRAEAAGFVAFEAGLSIRNAFQRLSQRCPDGEHNRLPTDQILTWYSSHLFGEVLAPAMLQDLAPLAERGQPDAICTTVGNSLLRSPRLAQRDRASAMHSGSASGTRCWGWWQPAPARSDGSAI